MQYTTYMEQCCVGLAQKKEFSTDELIRYFVRSQELSLRVQDTFSYDDLDNTEIRGEQITSLTTRSLLSELDHVESTVPQNLRDNITLTLDLLLLRSWIHEVAFHSECWETPDKDRLLTPKMSTLSVARIKLLLSSIQSWKAFLKSFLSHPNSEMFYLTYPTFSKLGYTMISLANLVHIKLGETNEHNSELASVPTVNMPERCLWKLGMIAREAELPLLARQVQQKFKDNATNVISANGEPDAMTIFSVLIGTMISIYDKRMRELQTSVVGDETAGSSTADPITIAQDQMVTDMDPTFFLGADAMNCDYADTGSCYLGQDPNIQLDVFEDTVWERLLDDFRMVPFGV